MIIDGAVEAIGTEYEAATGGQRDRPECVHIEVFARANAARDDVTGLTLASLFLGEVAFTDALGHERVVARELAGATFVHDIDAAIADVGEPGLSAVDDRGDHGGGHAVKVRFALCPLPQHAVHVAEGGAEAIRWCVPGARGHLLFQKADGRPAGDLTRAFTAHAIGDGQQQRALGQCCGEDGILVVGAPAAAVGERRYPVHERALLDRGRGRFASAPR